MNYNIYKYLITPFIEQKDRQILIKDERWLMGIKKRELYKPLYVKIMIHLGSPCYRHCICYLMKNDDLFFFYNKYFILDD